MINRSNSDFLNPGILENSYEIFFIFKVNKIKQQVKWIKIKIGISWLYSDCIVIN